MEHNDRRAAAFVAFTFTILIIMLTIFAVTVRNMVAEHVANIDTNFECRPGETYTVAECP